LTEYAISIDPDNWDREKFKRSIGTNIETGHQGK
jgi:hypothetical protein